LEDASADTEEQLERVVKTNEQLAVQLRDTQALVGDLTAECDGYAAKKSAEPLYAGFINL
jgi:hypothetical protein